MVDLPPPTLPEPQPLPEPEPACEPESESVDTCLGAEQAENAGGPDGGERPSAEEQPPKKERVAFTAVEIAAQIHQVQEWLTEGKRPNQVRRLCSEQWGLSTRVSENRMHEARKQMVLDVNQYERKDMAAKMLQSLEKVLEQALATNQGSNAIGAMKLQADLLQLIARQN